MANSKSGTLVAATVKTVVVDTNGDDVQVENLDPSSSFSIIWVRTDGTDPIGLGTDNDVAVSGTRIFGNPTGRRQMSLKLISTAAIPYNVSACMIN